jgi:hypothetical protein
VSVDDRIRDALDASVALPDLDLDALDRAEADVRTTLTERTRRRHRAVIATASALAAAAAVLIAVLVWPGPNHETVNTGAILPPATTPAGAGHLVSIAWPGNGARGEVVIRSAATGRVERTLPAILPSQTGEADLSVTADGRYLYYGWYEAEKCITSIPGGCTGGGIERISLTDGALAVVSSRPTYALAVSPDGRYLAATQAVAAPLDPAHVTVTDLRTGTTRTWDAGRDTQDGVSSSDWRVTNLSFAPDDRHVAISMDATTFGSPILRSRTFRVISTLDTDRPSSESNPRVVPPGARAPQRWQASYSASSNDLVALEWCGQPPCPTPARPVRIDVSSGRSQSLSGGLASTNLPASDASLATGRSGVVYAIEPDLCPRCNGFGGRWAIYRIESGVVTILASAPDTQIAPGTYAGPPDGLAWIP